MIRLSSVTKKYGDQNIFENFSLEIYDNQTTSLIASSGAGKSTLLNLISGCLKQDAGSIDFFENGTLLKDRPKISYIFQESTLLPWYSARKNVEIVLENQFSREECRRRSEFYLDKVGLGDKMNAFPEQLSGGEKQRVSIARSFAFPSKILLMDEAFQSQDLKTRIALLELLENLLKEEQKTVVFVTHDIREAFCISDRIVVMEGRPLKIKKEIDNTINRKPCENGNSYQANSGKPSMKERYVNPGKSAIQAELEIL